MALTWTSIVGGTDTAGVLTKTAGGDGWGTCGAVSNETESGDLLFSYLWKAPFTPNGMVGIGGDSSCSNYNTIDYGMNSQSSRQIGLYENGTNVVGGTTVASISDDGVLLEIVRIGTTIAYYYTPYTGSAPSPGAFGTRLYTSTNSSSGTARMNAAIYYTTKTYDANDMGLTSTFTPPTTFGRVTAQDLEVGILRTDQTNAVITAQDLEVGLLITPPGDARVTSVGLQAALIRSSVPGDARVTSAGLQVAILRGVGVGKRTRGYIINVD